MNRRSAVLHPRTLLLAALTAAPLAIALALIIGPLVRDEPTLGPIPRLLAARKFDEVEGRLLDYLRHHPESIQAHMLLAQSALNREDPRPRLALDHLRFVRAGDRPAQAIVRLYEGKAHAALSRYDEAEADWLDALRLDPKVPEAGWNLIGLYDSQGRHEAARRLALRLHATEPDPRDRVQLLLELIRQDAQPIGAYSIVESFTPVVRDHPDDFHSSAALGRALIRESRADEGLAFLRPLLERRPDDPEAWRALLSGLDDAGRYEEMARTVARLPEGLAHDPQFASYLGRLAQERQAWDAAADSYVLAWGAEPFDHELTYRLGVALRNAGRLAEAERFEELARGMRSAREEASTLYEEANAIKTLGTAPHPDLYRRIAGNREGMGRPDEARAWYRLVLRDRPGDPISLWALARLSDEPAAGGATPP